MDVDNIEKQLTEMGKREPARDFLSSLNQRKKAELEFHDMHRDQKLVENQPQDVYELLYGNKKFYSTIRLSREYVNHWLGKQVPGKIFLDYACGNGERVIEAAKQGARLSIGLDISGVSIENGRRAAILKKVSSRCIFIQGDCENTGLPDASIDVILCSGMLHHLDLSYAFPELRRVLARNGIMLAVEALDYNPFIKLYRKVTPAMRTAWEKEHILSMKDLKFADRFFDVGKVRFWHLFSVFAAYMGKTPYLQRTLLVVLNWFDKLLLRVPLIQLMSWQFTFELYKRPDD